MPKEKFSNEQKKGFAELNPSGEEIIILSKITNASPSTIYKAKREGELLKQLDDMKQANRELIVQKQLLDSVISSRKIKKSMWHS